MIDEPQTLKSGGGVAAPLARKILKDILPYLGVEPNYSEKEIANLDLSTPNVVGATTGAAATTLKANSLTYRVVGDGKNVVRQSPKSGSAIPKGGEVWLYTDNREPSTATVPDFTGRTVSQVKQAAEAAGINVLLSGITTGDGVPSAVRQSVKAGETVEKGAAITVEFTYTDNIE
jgi:stage V sporulation protein D (sporulation-specific penicillin-binding protein)